MRLLEKKVPALIPILTVGAPREDLNAQGNKRKPFKSLSQASEGNQRIGTRNKFACASSVKVTPKNRGYIQFMPIIIMAKEPT